MPIRRNSKLYWRMKRIRESRNESRYDLFKIVFLIQFLMFMLILGGL